MPFDKSRMQVFVNFADLEDNLRAEVDQRRDQILLTEARNGERDPFDVIVDYLNHPQWDTRLTTLIGLSGGSMERMKRVASAILPNQRLPNLQNDVQARQTIARFLIEPNTFANQVPEFIRRCFYLRAGWIPILRDERQVTALVINSLKSKYSVQCGFAQEQRIVSAVHASGLTCDKGAVEYVNNKEVDVAIPNTENPEILIMSSFSLTTSSAQTMRANEQILMRDEIARRNRLRAGNTSVQIWNVIDGGGWIERNNDLDKIINHAHANFCNIDIDDGTFRAALEDYKNGQV